MPTSKAARLCNWSLATDAYSATVTDDAAQTVEAGGITTATLLSGGNQNYVLASVQYRRLRTTISGAVTYLDWWSSPQRRSFAKQQRSWSSGRRCRPLSETVATSMSRPAAPPSIR